ncbi:hypothetical protein V491_00245 [Pseudogymnoascus sp. VKM F-3775]|nr:hypothetical protein V491_00245 [Pseudogymnoascus sp. VKM F-3775]
MSTPNDAAEAFSSLTIDQPEESSTAEAKVHSMQVQQELTTLNWPSYANIATAIAMVEDSIEKMRAQAGFIAVPEQPENSDLRQHTRAVLIEIEALQWSVRNLKSMLDHMKKRKAILSNEMLLVQGELNRIERRQ